MIFFFLYISKTKDLNETVLERKTIVMLTIIKEWSYQLEGKMIAKGAADPFSILQQ